MQEKVVGYVLLLAGIGIILFSAMNVYMVFTKRSQPVALFAFPGISLDIQQLATGTLQEQLSSLLSENQENIPPQLLKQFNKNDSSSPKQEIIPAAIVNDPMNYMAHVFFMGFIATIGMKIGKLGTLLIRTITVNVKEKTPSKKDPS